MVDDVTDDQAAITMQRNVQTVSGWEMRDALGDVWKLIEDRDTKFKTCSCTPPLWAKNGSTGGNGRGWGKFQQPDRNTFWKPKQPHKNKSAKAQSAPNAPDLVVDLIH